MRRFLSFILVLFCFSGLAEAQKIKVISVFQLIENGKFEEAKKAIEEAITEEKTMHWSRTWYARGLLCQKAYQAGIKDKDRKKYELYPEQLYVAYDSYEKALSLETRGRIEDQVAPMFIILANDFQKIGENHYQSKKYEEALRAFEHALSIIRNPVLIARADTNLIYNTALAAYDCKAWDKAIEYLKFLHQAKYSSNVSQLLSDSYLQKGDTLSAENALIEGIDRYKDNEDLVLLLVDLLYQRNDFGRIVAILDTASMRDPTGYIFPYTKGLVFQKKEKFDQAIDAYQKAISLAPGDLNIYMNLSTCYYNSGVGIDEKARSITNNRIFREEKAKSEAAFGSAVSWLEKAYEKDPANPAVRMKLYQLYKALRLEDKLRKMENQID